MIRKIFKSGDQLIVSLPKNWAMECGLQKGDYVEVLELVEPAVEVLKEVLKNGYEVVLGDENYETKQSEIEKFVSDGVLLKSGDWMKFSEIVKITIHKGGEIDGKEI